MRGLKFWSYKQPGIQELRDIRAYIAAIQRGHVPGATILEAYGRMLTTTSTVFKSVWPGPTQRVPYSPTAVAMTVQSSSPLDLYGTSGCQQVVIHYIDDNGDEYTASANLNGVVPVAIPNARFIQCMHMSKGVVPIGDITIVSGATVYSYMSAGFERCTSTTRYVPRGKTAFITDLTGGSISGTAATQTELRFATTTHEGVSYINEGIYLPYNGMGFQDNSFGFSPLVSFAIPAGNLFTIDAKADKSAIVTASIYGWYEETSDALEIV